MTESNNNSIENKKLHVEQMFDNVSNHYDFLNHFLSFGIDILWRKKAIKMMKKFNPQIILDVASGTADMAILAYKILHPVKITGIDLSIKMLERGRIKVKKQGFESSIHLIKGDSEKLDFKSGSFDAVMVAFGVRNFDNLDSGLNEIYRVLRHEGIFVVLEFSKPSLFLFKSIYNFYFFSILPLIGKMISKNKSAYTYLPESVNKFPSGRKFITILESHSFKTLSYKKLSFGIASIYFVMK